MGRVARVLQTEDLLETVEIYSGANVTAKAYGAGGDDAPPLENDRVLLVPIEGTGNYAVAGVLGKSQGAKPGERILYSRGLTTLQKLRVVIQKKKVVKGHRRNTKKPTKKPSLVGVGIKLLQWIVAAVATSIISTILEHYLPLWLGW